MTRSNRQLTQFAVDRIGCILDCGAGFLPECDTAGNTRFLLVSSRLRSNCLAKKFFSLAFRQAGSLLSWFALAISTTARAAPLVPPESVSTVSLTYWVTVVSFLKVPEFFCQMMAAVSARVISPSPWGRTIPPLLF